MKQNKDNKQSKDHHIARILSLNLFKYFNFILIALIIVILVLGFVFVLKPKYEKITENIQETNIKLENELVDLNFNKAVLEGYKNNYDNLDFSARDRLDKFLPSGYDRESLFVQMETLIIGQGFILDSIKLTDLNALVGENPRGKAATLTAPAFVIPTGVGVNEINLEISGVDYNGIKHLLSILEKSINIYDVVDLSFADAGALSLKLYSYYLL